LNDKTLKKIQDIVILGGGTSGWFTAAILAYQFKNAGENSTPTQPKINIKLVESDQIGTIGVGEATIPPFIDALKSIEIDIIDFIKKTQSTFKLAIKFTDWQLKNSQLELSEFSKNNSYLHPFGQLGQDIHNQQFYQCWLKMQSQDNATIGSIMDYSPSAQMVENNQFSFPFQAKNTPIEASAFALHIDAKLAADYFREYAEKLGVVRTEGLVENVIKEDDGSIQSLKLQNGSIVDGDFFFDCSGFRSIIIGDSLKVEFEDWSKFLTVDTAVTVQTTDETDFPLFTESKAQDFGWTWRIPLQTRTGNGYVFDSNFCSIEDAKNTLLKTVIGRPLSEPMLVKFKTGIRKKSWEKNCIAIGLSSGFLEPLESTAIHMITRGVKHFVRLFPEVNQDQCLSAEYNKRMRYDYEEIRDFLIVHYCLTKRNDTKFWQYYRNMELTDTLKQRINLFSKRGIVNSGSDDLFIKDNWIAVMQGMGVIPESYDPLLDHYPFEETAKLLKTIPNRIDDSLKSLLNHKEFIDHYCPTIL